MKVEIQRADLNDVRDLAAMAGEYQAEMVALAGVADFVFEQKEKEAALSAFLENADYAVLIARSVRGHPLGYVTVFESLPYSNDPHGIIEQIYIRPFYRQRRIARRLMAKTRELAGQKRWRRLMVMFPLAFHLDAARAFFEKQGFGDPGRRKLWLRV
ncbi:GNAT family N-acetyltransferase [Oxalobacter sp. OttesenSCG-928-P03]|nr:GNAT family N-acetyltransferase [Oxalobacter sp. OttesenSCG-928-P03]